MKKVLSKLNLLPILIVLFAGKSFAQANLSDTSSERVAVDRTVSGFYRAIGQQSRLYNGHEYLSYDPHIKGTALFPYDVQNWESGEVTYDGILYKNVPMKYDIYKDVVVVLLYNKFSMYTLLSDKVQDFTFDNHHFVKLEADSIKNNNPGISTGFYELLYGGIKTEVLAKRVKTIQNSSTTVAAPETSFASSDNYYLRKGNTYYKISSQRSVLNILKDRKGEIQQYLKQNNISFKDSPEQAMSQMAAFYDHASN